ncbi:MAG: sigma-70 family RNA polymerase sigma factor [Catalinimonas sp.]
MNEEKYQADQTRLAALRRGDRRALDDVYLEYRVEFFAWLRKHFGLPPEQAADIYQEAMLITIENIQSGKLKTLTASLKTYLFAVGRNLARKRTSSPVLVLTSDTELPADTPDVDAWEEEQRLDARQRLVSEELQQLGEPCRSLLRMYYYERRSMKEICAELSYKNENVVKSQKVRCMKKLRECVLDKSHE